MHIVLFVLFLYGYASCVISYQYLAEWVLELHVNKYMFFCFILAAKCLADILRIHLNTFSVHIFAMQIISYFTNRFLLHFVTTIPCQQATCSEMTVITGRWR